MKGDYAKALLKYNHWAITQLEKGKDPKPKLSRGLSDVFRVFLKNGARGNVGIIHRLTKFGIKTFQRQNRIDNFNDVALYICANTSLTTRTFSRDITQSVMAKDLGVSQSTISRILALMLKMGLLRPAFCGDNDPTDQKKNVTDKHGIPLNQIYMLTHDFGYLAGKTVGDKLIEAFTSADEKAEKDTGFTLHDRLLCVRATAWEGTIERRVKNITTGCLKKAMGYISDYSRACQHVYKRLLNRGELHNLDESQVTKLVRQQVAYCGYGSLLE